MYDGVHLKYAVMYVVEDKSLDEEAGYIACLNQPNLKSKKSALLAIFQLLWPSWREAYISSSLRRFQVYFGFCHRCSSALVPPMLSPILGSKQVHDSGRDHRPPYQT